MTMIFQWIGQTVAAVSLVSAVPRLLRDVVAQVVAWSERRAVTDQLANMSDHELADIGLHRGQISEMFGPEFTLTRSTRAGSPLPGTNASWPIWT